MSILAEVPGFLQVFSDGSVLRLAPDHIAPASPTESSIGYMSKDVIIDALKPVTARMFIPSTSGSRDSLPVLVYFHGGGFCIGSTTWYGYHHFLGDLCAAVRCIVLSVDYRLAPENRLPIAYKDCYSSLEWLGCCQSTEPWLDRANLSCLFMSGDSAGGNIAHQVAIMATQDQVPGIQIRGIILIHPYFGSEKRTAEELADGSASYVAMNDLFWNLSIPEGSNRDYSGCNLEAAEISPEEWDRFPSVMVFVAGLDFLKERGVSYAEFMRKRGVKNVKLAEAEGEQHVYHVYHPKSEATRLLQKQMSDFMAAFGTKG
ncbi:hypothetical protein CDL15_Pgr020828 [Punica granatum]|uniref:Alpha/beta hydrolase fold-3 domain-containing protein n=1 Tax=Punica granatum TaxID=22663 RepID=A0A218XV87_PUNGR|nr:hypothetical protein CDL15_Pgr020828 [Punica granatum]PKI48429.1 hypothetical protein CRG98_031181 [Punica granatum]